LIGNKVGIIAVLKLVAIDFVRFDIELSSVSNVRRTSSFWEMD